MKAILSKLSNNENALRSNNIEGEIDYLPTLGCPVILYAESLKGLPYTRIIRTSPVMVIEQDEAIFRLTTLNSIYKLELLPPEDWEE